MLAGWLGVALKPLRSMSLAIGTELESVDLSDSPLSDQMLEVFAARLFSLHSLKLSGCHAVGNIGIRTVSDVCFETLAALDLSRCPRIDSETLGWVAGTLGRCSHTRSPPIFLARARCPNAPLICSPHPARNKATSGPVARGSSR